MTLWFISDTHFGHANILNFVYALDTQTMARVRPFDSEREMDEHMIQKWNSVVRPQDHIYHLGDLTMARGKGANTQHIDGIMKRLNGHKRIILGNHDDLPAKWYLQWFEKVKASRVLDNILFTHIPVHPASLGRFRANVHGHIHQNIYPDPRYLNVSVEAVDYTPVSLETLKQQIVIRELDISANTR